MAGPARTILHVDMDAFFVSVELRRRPELRGQPVVVGGTGQRGVVAAASYEARRYGIRSAMPSTTARCLCPHAVFLPGDHEHYQAVSAQVRTVFDAVTPLVEPLSLDEAFLDVTGAARLLGDGVAIAWSIRGQVLERFELSCSVGVAPSKFLAKLAGEAAKPSATTAGVIAGKGVVEVLPGDELAFLHPLPVSALWGVGPATLARLARLGVRTVGDLAALDERALVAAVGRAHGEHLHRLAWARDDRPVEPDRGAKSIGHEETYPRDLHTADELQRELVRLADAVAARLRSQGTGARTLTLKVRFHGFDTITRAVTLGGAVDTAHAIVRELTPLLAAVDPSPGVRLLGVSGSNLVAVSEQLRIDDLLVDGAEQATQEWGAAERTVDEIRSRFGTRSIGPASSVGPTGLRPVRRGAQQWGPDGQHPT